jgi:hypothetical protein
MSLRHFKEGEENGQSLTSKQPWYAERGRHKDRRINNCRISEGPLLIHSQALSSMPANINKKPLAGGAGTCEGHWLWER